MTVSPAAERLNPAHTCSTHAPRTQTRHAHGNTCSTRARTRGTHTRTPRTAPRSTHRATARTPRARTQTGVCSGGRAAQGRGFAGGVGGTQGAVSTHSARRLRVPTHQRVALGARTQQVDDARKAVVGRDLCACVRACVCCVCARVVCMRCRASQQPAGSAAALVTRTRALNFCCFRMGASPVARTCRMTVRARCFFAAASVSFGDATHAADPRRQPCNCQAGYRPHNPRETTHSILGA